MGFFNIIGLMALIGVPVIIILHMLKRKQKDMIIPSTYLWERAVDTSVQSKPWQKLKKSLPLILQLTAAAALGLAAARPYISAFGEAYNYVIVMDSSMSMTASDMGGTRLEFSKERAKDIIGSASALSKITIIDAGDSPYVVYGPGTDKASAVSALESIKPTGGGIDRDTLDGLIASAAAKTDGGIYIFTDSGNNFSGLDANIFYAGNETANCAVTLASAADGNILANVRNYGENDERKTVTVYNGNMVLALSDVTVPAGSERSVIFENVYQGSGKFSVVISPGDVLEADDTFYLAVNEARTAKVLLVSEGNTFLENAFGLVDGVELYRMTPDTMETAGLFGYDLYVFDGALPDVMPDDGGIFIIDPPEGNGYIPTGESRSLNCYSEGASELGGGDSLSFIISEAKTVERPSWAVTECSADGVPLIMRGENGAQKVCVFAFDIHDSDLPLLKEFPVMIYNLSDWFMPGRLGNGSEAKCGQSLEINAPADAAKIEITDPDGNGRVIAPPFPASEYSDTPEPGFYTVYIENSDGETSETAIAVNALTDGESDLEALYGQDVEGSAGRASKGGASLTGILTILAAAALLAEWWVKYYGNRRG